MEYLHKESTEKNTYSFTSDNKDNTSEPETEDNDSSYPKHPTVKDSNGNESNLRPYEIRKRAETLVAPLEDTARQENERTIQKEEKRLAPRTPTRTRIKLKHSRTKTTPKHLTIVHPRRCVTTVGGKIEHTHHPHTRNTTLPSRQWSRLPWEAPQDRSKASTPTTRS